MTPQHRNRNRTRHRAIAGLAIAALGLGLPVLSMITQRSFSPGGQAALPARATAGTCPGDVNGDGQRDIRDLTLIQAHVSGKQSLDGVRLDAADVNVDGKVDVLDVVRLQQHITRQQLLAECRGTLVVSPASVDFGTVNAGQSADRTLAVSNTGSGALTVTSMSSASPAFSAPLPAVPFSVAAGAQQAVTVRFTPPAPGSQAGLLAISATSAGATLTASVALSGTGATPANPAPVISALSPASATAGGTGFVLTVDGENFVNASVVRWNGADRPTTFVSATRLTAVISAEDIAGEGTISVSVFSPAPGGGTSASQPFVVNPDPDLPPLGPAIKFIAPRGGQAGSQFTLLGRGFDPAAANNRVRFLSESEEFEAQVVSAADNSIVATVPAGLQAGGYNVTVTVGGSETNGVGYRVSTQAAPLVLRPSSPFLLMPPGSGKEYLVVGGGTPPYSLKPLSAQDQPKAGVELKGSVLEVTGLDPGEAGVTTIQVGVADSASPPATARTTVRVQVPRFEPQFDVIPHTLLAGSSPGFTLRIRNFYGQMRLLKTKIQFGKARTDLSSFAAGAAVGLTTLNTNTFGMFGLTEVESPSNARFQMVNREIDDTVTLAGEGTIEPGALTLISVPEPPREGVFTAATDIEVVLSHNLFTLPEAGDEPFTIAATFTSTTVLEGKNLPLTAVRTKTFQTAAAPTGAPKILSMFPPQGESGREVRLHGSGFTPVAADNQVTFAGAGGERVQATLKSATAGRLAVFVPFDGTGGPVRVAAGGVESNDYAFRLLFRPEGEISFAELKGNTPAAPLLVVEQPGADRVAIDSAAMVLDDGKVTVAELEENQPAGSASLTDNATGLGESFFVVYSGQEEAEAGRHFFDLKSSLEDSSARGRIFLSEHNTGKGVTFEVLPGQMDLHGSILMISFEKNVYLPPATGTAVNSRVEIRSKPWNFFPETEMLVRSRVVMEVD